MQPLTKSVGRRRPVGAVAALSVEPGSAEGGPEIWNVVAWGDVRECRTISSVMEEVREAVELGCRTISIERQGAPNKDHQFGPQENMTTPTDPSANQSTPIEPTDGRGSELGGAPGSAIPEITSAYLNLGGARSDALMAESAWEDENWPDALMWIEEGIRQLSSARAKIKRHVVSSHEHPHPLMCCPKCGEFRGHGHECKANTELSNSGHKETP